MKNHFLLILISILFIGCGGVKKTQEAINYGNYDEFFYNNLRCYIITQTLTPSVTPLGYNIIITQDGIELAAQNDDILIT